MRSRHPDPPPLNTYTKGPKLAIDEYSLLEDRIQDARYEKRQKLLDAWSTAAAHGASLMRPDPTYRPLSEDVKARIGWAA